MFVGSKIPKAIFDQHTIVLGKTRHRKKEIWKAILGFPHYQVSSLGRVRRVEIGFPKQYLGTRGYFHVVLSEKGNAVTKNVHALVASAFKGPRPKGMTCNHEDGNKQNNEATNIKYRTQKYQIQHSMRLGLTRPPQGERNGHSILTERQVRRIKALVREGRTNRDIAHRFGVAPDTIRHISAGRRWRHVQ